MAADVGAGLAYLAGAFVAGGAGVVTVRRRSGIAREMVDRNIDAAERATGWRRYLYGGWADSRLRYDPEQRDQAVYWTSMPLVIFFPFLSFVLLLAAVAAFLK